MSIDTSENQSSNPSAKDVSSHLSSLIDARLTRRGVLGGLAGAYGLAVTACQSESESQSEAETDLTFDLSEFSDSTFDFKEISRGIDETHHISDGHQADILLRWGDPLFDDSPEFDPYAQTAEAQRKQFGYNNDFIGFIPLSEGRGLLCVNHEYTSTNLMLPEFDENKGVTREESLVELAAHGGSIVEIVQNPNGQWRPVIGSNYNRRITGNTTPMEVSGPAAGHKRLQTKEDPSGRIVAGTLNNCAGGITPWGTYLMAEENFNGCFMGDLPDGHPEKENHTRYGVPAGWYDWGRYFDRYDISKSPNEPNRYGWIVEVDPMDPTSRPKKRTALGRFKHEGAETVIAPDGRLVIYMGDDQRFDYLYKFVSNQKVDLTDRARNSDLLDDGILYVAKFFEKGVLEWIALTHGQGPLTAENGFSSQAEVMIEARRAGDLLEATPMDRPEDVEPDPKTGRVWVMLTNNSRRKSGDVNPANPRAKNVSGHIIEITEPNGDFTSTVSEWDIIVRCGDPKDRSTTWNPNTSENGWFGSPDNCALDVNGRLWIATDGNDRTGAADGLWALDTDGSARGTGKAFFRVPIGAELCGPRFTDDGKTLFLAVQHPGDGNDASFENPTTRWPDFKDNMPPRPAVMAIRNINGKIVGSR